MKKVWYNHANIVVSPASPTWLSDQHEKPQPVFKNCEIFVGVSSEILRPTEFTNLFKIYSDLQKTDSGEWNLISNIPVERILKGGPIGFDSDRSDKASIIGIEYKIIGASIENDYAIQIILKPTFSLAVSPLTSVTREYLFQICDYMGKKVVAEFEKIVTEYLNIKRMMQIVDSLRE